MRVLFLISGATLSDGIARHILTLCEYFSALDEVEVAVCVSQGEGDLTTSLRAVGTKVYVLNGQNGHDWRIFRRFHNVIREFKPDLIHSHVMSLNIRIYLSLFARSLPIATTVHGMTDPAKNWSQKRKAFFELLLNRFFSVNEQTVLMISNEIQRMIEAGKAKFSSRVLYNPVSLKNTPLRDATWLKSEINIPLTAPLIGFIGRLAEVKDLPAFLLTARILLTINSDCHFVVVGDGPDEKYKESEWMKGLETKVHWLGYRKDAKKIMAALDVFVLTSFREGMPTVLLEAFSVRTPVVAFVSPGGVREVYELSRKYDGGVGLFVESRDSEELAKTIQMILCNQELRSVVVENGFRLVQDEFDVEVIGSRLNRIYCEVHNSSKKA